MRLPMLLSDQSTLFTGSGNVALQSFRSARGVQQGDLLGPVLFALAVHPAIAEARAATEVSHPGGIDVCSFFLDDGFCAGSSAAVRCFLSALTESFLRIGLTVNLDKTEVIPTCSLAQSFCPADFQGCSWNRTSNFKLLGAPIGSDAWCEELLGRHVGKARALLSAIGRFPDAQGALAALGQLIGRPLTEEDWRLASLGVAAGGLGARCAAEHAPAASVASFSACRELCGRLWPAFDPFDLDEGCRLAAAEDALRGTIPSGASIYAVSDTPSQKSLSGMVEAQSVSAIFGDPTLPRHRRLHLEACRVPGAGAWLTANPSCIDSHIWLSSVVFAYRYGNATRLAACAGKFSTAGEITPLPGGIGFCATTRSEMWSAPRSLSSRRSHLSLRSLASFSPRGPPDPGGPHLDADPSSASSPSPAASRRPADVWVPRGVSGFAEAWDFSVSSLLRPSHLSSASPSVADVFHEVETRKRAFQDTASLVAERGATFCPLVLESCGRGGEEEGVVPSSSERRSLDCL